MGQVDLHTHSNVSDGLLTPAELVREAARRGLRVLALTDHDTVDGLAEAEQEAGSVGMDFVPGVELNTDIGPYEVHILGYFVDRTDPELRARLAWLEAQRRARIARIVTRLAEIGRPVKAERVWEIAGRGAVGRPHVARAMIEAGYVDSVSAAFDRYLASGRPGFVPRTKNSPEDAIDVIRRGGGVPVLAHPLTAGAVDAVVDRLLPAGLMGIEVYYAEYDETIWRRLRLLADRHGLIPTGGSDYHGEGFNHGRDLGAPPVPFESVALLRRAATRVGEAKD